MSKVGMWKLERETAAFQALKAHLGDEAEGMGLDLAESETGLLEAIDACIIQYREEKAEEEKNKGLKVVYEKRAKAAENRRKLISTALDKVRRELQVPSIKRDVGTVYKRKVGEGVNITEPDKVPNAYRSNDYTPPPDKARILDALKNGEEIDGCEYVPESEGTSIR